jgi:hypothetical protein
LLFNCDCFRFVCNLFFSTPTPCKHHFLHFGCSCYMPFTMHLCWAKNFVKKFIPMHLLVKINVINFVPFYNLLNHPLSLIHNYFDPKFTKNISPLLSLHTLNLSNTQIFHTHIILCNLSLSHLLVQCCSSESNL